MIDFTRAKLFCIVNNFNHDQIDEFISIIKDATHQAIEECDQKMSILFEKHHEKVMKIMKSDH